jgi:hypothetical protein
MVGSLRGRPDERSGTSSAKGNTPNFEVSGLRAVRIHPKSFGTLPGERLFSKSIRRWWQKVLALHPRRLAHFQWPPSLSLHCRCYWSVSGRMVPVRCGRALAALRRCQLHRPHCWPAPKQNFGCTRDWESGLALILLFPPPNVHPPLLHPLLPSPVPSTILAFSQFFSLLFLPGTRPSRTLPRVIVYSCLGPNSVTFFPLSSHLSPTSRASDSSTSKLR